VLFIVCQALDLVEMLRREEEMLVAVQAANNEVSPIIILRFTWINELILCITSSSRVLW
jgi:hypothetical protein